MSIKHAVNDKWRHLNRVVQKRIFTVFVGKIVNFLRILKCVGHEFSVCVSNCRITEGDLPLISRWGRCRQLCSFLGRGRCWRGRANVQWRRGPSCGPGPPTQHPCGALSRSVCARQRSPSVRRGWSSWVVAERSYYRRLMS